jgi:predicted membrane-bound spermidine synthase
MVFVRSNILVLCMVFMSGFSVMSVEMLGGRILAPYFGGSVYVWGSLIFTFMVGLSLGYGVGGRLSVRFYGIKVLGILLCASAVQVLLIEFFSDWVLGVTFAQTNDPRTGSLLAALALYLLPTATMGTLSPVAIRTISSELHKVGSSAGNLYLVSTLGSAVGTLITAFWLVASCS